MVSNQYIDPFDRVKTYSIGFDRMFNSLLDAPASTGYPPYNIVKDSEEKYCIELAIAGFSKSDIIIESKDNILTIESTIDFQMRCSLETCKISYL